MKYIRKKNLKAKNYNLKANDGVSLIEMIIAIGIFAVVVSINLNMFLNVIAGQRKATHVQHITDNSRYVMEAIAREIRVGVVDSFPVDGTYSSLTFTSGSENRSGQGIKISYNAIEKTVEFDDDTASAGDEVSITSSQNIQISLLEFIVANSAAQPKITVVLKAIPKVVGDVSDDIILQTTISPKAINI